jgi:hypothetical protein
VQTGSLGSPERLLEVNLHGTSGLDLALQRQTADKIEEHPTRATLECVIVGSLHPG